MAILSIQSHVAYGHAGNSAAVFPLQRLGRDVWAVNTVEFSNHTGYGAWRGKVLEAGLAEELVAGIEDRGVLQDCEAVLRSEERLYLHFPGRTPSDLYVWIVKHWDFLKEKYGGGFSLSEAARDFSRKYGTVRKGPLAFTAHLIDRIFNRLPEKQDN
jgi:hypothetical protein